MEIKNEVLYRVYFLLFGIVIPASVILLYRTVQISYLDGEKWRQLGNDLYRQDRKIEAERGNIYAADGSLLATSIPFFDIYFDPMTPTEEDFNNNLDSLAYCLATYTDDSYTVGGYREFLKSLRDSTDRHVLLKKGATYSDKNRMEQFPLFELGRFRGGFIVEKRSRRMRPFGLLAQRTVGYVRENAKPVGLEGSFNEVLAGHPGHQVMVCVDKKRDIWIPVEDLAAIEPRSGDDIVTTIDINLQDITEEALLRAMNYHDAEWGTAILMEVRTGAIRGIANLGRTDDGWYETFNHAIGTSIEPGSTFKLASIMALLEDGFVKLTDSVIIEGGKTQFYEETMLDASPFSKDLDTTTVRRAFEISSNVGMAKLVNENYSARNKANKNEGAERFIKRLKQFNLHQPTGIEVDGEANPYIKEAYNPDDNWSGTTLPWMAIGYEVKVTPLQLLTFYNAVANNGEMVKPYLVTEIQRNGETIEQFKPTVVKRSIASRRTIEQAQELLESVVENGTAYKLKTDLYGFAGKTGTAQINYRKVSNRTRIGGYQASFAGYFPAHNPRYSCIVVINRPRRNGYYGSDVAGPVFREIADKSFFSKVDLYKPFEKEVKVVALPQADIGDQHDIREVLDYLGISYHGDPATDYTVLRARSDSLILEKRTLLRENEVPDVIGMGLRDALYLLENRGLKVEVKGYGKVALQSIKPGTRVKGQNIRLTLQ